MTMGSGTPAFMSREAFEETPKHHDGMSFFAGRDWYAFGCCLLLMLLGEKGGTTHYVAGRYVLLPADKDSVPTVMERADRTGREDAFELVSALLAENVEDRACSQEIRSSAFLREALNELETLAPQLQTHGS